MPKGYKIRTFLDGDFVQNITIPFENTYAVVEDLLPSSQYVFAICAFNRVGDGPSTQIVSSTGAWGKSWSTCKWLRVQ